MPVLGKRASFTCAMLMLLPVSVGIVLFGAALERAEPGAGMIVMAAAGGIVLLTLLVSLIRTGAEVRQGTRGVLGVIGPLERLYYLKETSRLHRSIHPLAASILEAAARDWQRIREALESPFFAHEPVPEHWKEIRTRVDRDADHAMMNLVSVLRECYTAGNVSELWDSVVERAISGSGELPAELAQIAKHAGQGAAARATRAMPLAIRLARDLRRLRIEVERLPLMAVEDPVLYQPPSSRMGDLLTHMEELRVAEEELEQSLGSGQ